MLPGASGGVKTANCASAQYGTDRYLRMRSQTRAPRNAAPFALSAGRREVSWFGPTSPVSWLSRRRCMGSGIGWLTTVRRLPGEETGAFQWGPASEVSRASALNAANFPLLHLVDNPKL